MSDRYALRAGATFRGVLNDLKRDERAAASDLSLPLEVIVDLVRGKKLAAGSILQRAVEVWPVNERDFFPVHDDCPDGALMMSREASRATSRIIERGGSPYYEYRDTAMSRVSSLRPEWIEMLVSVENQDPHNASVRWNNGHLLFQFTYFVGKVNYYYEWNGQRFCRAMNTGDSVFGLPYAPHSFAKRHPKEQAFILALTYGGRLSGDAQHELSALGPELSAAHALPVDAARGTWAALLCRHMANAELSSGELARRSELAEARLLELTRGAASPAAEELEQLAAALQVSPRELVPLEPDVKHGVRFVRAGDAPMWFLPSEQEAEYRVRGLAGSRITPFARSLEIEILRSRHQPVRHTLRSGLHEYGYNVGEQPCLVEWTLGGRDFCRLLSPGDSFYMKPFVPHRLSRDEGAGSGHEPPRVVVLRAGGKVVGDASLEASVIGAEGLRRIAEDHRRWFDPGASGAENPAG